MTQPNQPHQAPPKPSGPAPHGRAPVPQQPTEPAEVLGRHKGTGQKDHKGAR